MIGIGRAPRAAGAAGLVLLAAALLPPWWSLARSHEVADAAQFAAVALVVPALCALAAAARWPSGRLATTRRGAVVLAAELGCVVGWRTPAAVAAVQADHWLVLAEASTLLVTGLGLFGVLLGARGSGRLAPTRRLAAAAIAMWCVWIVAYVAGMASSGEPGFHHVAGRGLSATADRELATVVLFAVAAITYLPVIFTSLFAWLRQEERRGAAASAAGLEARGRVVATE